PLFASPVEPAAVPGALVTGRVLDDSVEGDDLADDYLSHVRSPFGCVLDHRTSRGSSSAISPSPPPPTRPPPGVAPAALCRPSRPGARARRRRRAPAGRRAMNASAEG